MCSGVCRMPRSPVYRGGRPGPMQPCAAAAHPPAAHMGRGRWGPPQQASCLTHRHPPLHRMAPAVCTGQAIGGAGAQYQNTSLAQEGAAGSKLPEMAPQAT